jgi:hypothetical protein
LLAPTQIGGKSGGEEDLTSSMFTTRRYLMFQVEKILKDKEFGHGIDTTKLTRDGELSMLTKLRKKEEVDSTLNMVSISTEHSISDQDSQCGELLKMSPTILDSEDSIFQEEDNKLGSSIESPRPSSQNTPNPTPFTWQATTVIHTLD